MLALGLFVLSRFDMNNGIITGMGHPQAGKTGKEPHPFDQFRQAMQKLVRVPKSELDAKLKEHNETKPERRAGRKPTRRKAE
jgi:hypothetical protein